MYSYTIGILYSIYDFLNLLVGLFCVNLKQSGRRFQPILLNAVLIKLPVIEFLKVYKKTRGLPTLHA